MIVQMPPRLFKMLFGLTASRLKFVCTIKGNELSVQSLAVSKQGFSILKSVPGYYGCGLYNLG